MSELGATFVAKAGLSEAEVLALNRNSFHPTFSWIAKERFRRIARLGEGFISGLRAKDGSWLSLIGGWRSNGTTYIDWQLTLSSFPTFSLGSAILAFLLEHEVFLQTKLLTFVDGTGHSISRVFIKEEVSDIVVARRCLSRKVLQFVASHFPLERNVLASTILADTLTWSEGAVRDIMS